MNYDPTRIDIVTDPQEKRMRGVAFHGNTPFDVPYISKISFNLWQGGCETGLELPRHIKHVVSLYPWERYETHRHLESELYVEMYDSIDQNFDQVDVLAQWINIQRRTGAVLVNCQAGLNRSSLVAARTLMRSDFPEDDFDSPSDIINHLRDMRSPAVLCNPAFAAEVESWHSI